MDDSDSDMSAPQANQGGPDLKEADLARFGNFESDSSDSDVEAGYGDRKDMMGDSDDAEDVGSDSDSLNAHKLELQKKER